MRLYNSLLKLLMTRSADSVYLLLIVYCTCSTYMVTILTFVCLPSGMLNDQIMSQGAQSQNLLMNQKYDNTPLNLFNFVCVKESRSVWSYITIVKICHIVLLSNTEYF